MRFGLSVNPTKYQAYGCLSANVLIRYRLDHFFSIEKKFIPYSPAVKDLGLLIDLTLDWRAQVTSVGQKVTGNLRKLYCFKSFPPLTTKITAASLSSKDRILIINLNN